MIYGHEWSISRNARAIIRFFIYNIFNKIIKRKEEKATVTLLWIPNSVIVFKLLTCLIWAANSTTATKKASLKLFRVLQTNTSFIQIESSVNWERMQCRNSVLHSIMYLCFRHWPIRNEIFFWVYYKCSYHHYHGNITSKKIVIIIWCIFAFPMFIVSW